MPIIKLRNSTRGNVKTGTLVRVDPTNPKGFITVNINDLPVIGAIAENVAPGALATINLIGGYGASSIQPTVTVSPTPPVNPQVNDIWINNSKTL